MTIKISGLTEVSVATVNNAISNFEELIAQANVAYQLACDRYIEDHRGTMFTGMLWWKKPITDPRTILVSDCDFVCGLYNSVTAKLVALGYADKNEIEHSNRASITSKGNTKRTFEELCYLARACEGTMFVNAEQAKFINSFK